MAQQLFYGSLYGTPLGTDSNSVVRVTGSVTGATLTVSGEVADYLGTGSIRPGMVISGSGYSSTVITSSGTTVTLADSGSVSASLFRLSPADGNYYVSSASFTDPNQGYSVNDITGSNDPEYITGSRVFGVQAKVVTKVGKYHQFEITDVLYRDTSSQQIGFYMAWNESGSEADTGDNIGGNLQYMSIMSLTNRFEFGTIFSRRVGNFSNLEVGADQAAYQIAIEQIDRFTTPTGSFTGSFIGELTGSLSGSFTGSIEATGSLEGEITGSFTGSIIATGSLTGSFSGSGEITSADTASSANNFQVRENLTILGDASVAGTLVADVIHTRYETASILYSSGSTKFGDTTDDIHNFTGSVNVTDNVSASVFEGIFKGALSSSAQIADEISGSFTLTSASFSTSQTNLSASISTDRTNLSSSAATALTNLSASLSSDVEDIVMGVVTVESASRAERAGAAESVDVLVQDVELTGSLAVSGSETNNDASVIIRNGYVYLENVPEFTTVTDAINAGLPSNAVFKINLGGITDSGNTARFLMIID